MSVNTFKKGSVLKPGFFRRLGLGTDPGRERRGEYLEREAGAVACVLPVHEQLVDLLHLISTNWKGKRRRIPEERSRCGGMCPPCP